MTEPRILATVNDYAGLIAALRQRVIELDCTFEAVDGLAGLPLRYSSKLLAPVPVKNLSRVSFGAILGALGLKLIVTEDLSNFEKIRKRLIQRTNRRHKVSDASGVMPARKRKKKSLLSGNSEWGKLMRMRQLAQMSYTERHRSARTAAQARWRQRRALAKQNPLVNSTPPLSVPVTGVELAQHLPTAI